MVDFYIVKYEDIAPEYNSEEDIAFIDLDKARQQLDYLATENNLKYDSFCIFHVEATDKQEILSSFIQRTRIRNYRILEKININTLNLYKEASKALRAIE